MVLATFKIFFSNRLFHRPHQCWSLENLFVNLGPRKWLIWCIVKIHPWRPVLSNRTKTRKTHMKWVEQKQIWCGVVLLFPLLLDLLFGFPLVSLVSCVCLSISRRSKTTSFKTNVKNKSNSGLFFLHPLSITPYIGLNLEKQNKALLRP